MSCESASWVHVLLLIVCLNAEVENKEETLDDKTQSEATSLRSVLPRFKCSPTAGWRKGSGLTWGQGPLLVVALCKRLGQQLQTTSCREHLWLSSLSFI